MGEQSRDIDWFMGGVREIGEGWCSLGVSLHADVFFLHPSLGSSSVSSPVLGFEVWFQRIAGRLD